MWKEFFMRISKVQVEFTSLDILSIINDYLHVEGLKLDALNINEQLDISGSYKAGVRVNFLVGVSLVSFYGTTVNLKISSIKVGKIKIFNYLIKLLMKKLLVKLMDIGIEVSGDVITINLVKILDKLPFYLNVHLEDIKLSEDKITVTTAKLEFSMDKSIKNNMANDTKLIEEKNIQIQAKTEEKRKSDSYTKIREKVEKELPSKYEKLLEYAFILPDILALFFRLFKDKRVPIKTKIAVGAVITYLASPLDLLPDFIPFVGKVDDLALAFFAFNKAVNEVPAEVIIENWEGDLNTLFKIKDGIKYINKAAGGNNVDRLLNFIEKAYKLSNQDNKE
jgi:uncharacterized membrane protein YkvA (DUF1232 family)